MLWFVTPAHGRVDVTGLALEQRARLLDELAGAGIDAGCLVIACDENLETARELGCETLELPNDHLADRVNAGIRYACLEGAATHVAYIGSDNWLHADVILAGGLPDEWTIVSGRRSFVVDVGRGVGMRTLHGGQYGVPPWIVPRALLERCGFAPIKREARRRIDGQLVRGIDGRYPRGPEGRRPARWEFRDPHDVARVGWKGGGDMTPYVRAASAFGVGPEVTPWRLLEAAYGLELILGARSLSAGLPAAQAA